MIAKGSDAQARTALAACAARLNRTPTASSRVDFIHAMSLTESFPASLTPLVSSDVETIDFVKSVIDGREGIEGGWSTKRAVRPRANWVERTGPSFSTRGSCVRL